MADLRGQELRDSYQNVVTDSGTDLNGIQNGNGADITARIVSSGSNSNGRWVRFADGTQICWNESFSSGVDGNDGGDLSLRFTNIWTFPTSFSSLPYTYGRVRGTSFTSSISVAAGWIVSGYRLNNYDENEVEFTLAKLTTQSQNFDTNLRINCIAIGTWK